MWSQSKIGKVDSLMGFGNVDKVWHEEWTPGRNLLNFPHPFRVLLTGPPNVGKSTVIKNILVRQDPPFERVVIVHADPEHTKEYDDLKDDADDGTIMLVPEIPAAETWEPEMQDGEEVLLKTLLIIDDLDLRTLNKDQRKNLDRTMGYVSTHRSISVCCATQDSFNLPPASRRLMSVYVIWRSPDVEALQMFAKKVGVRDLRLLFDRYCKTRRDSIWLDLTDGSPAPLRLNGFTVIK